MLPVEQIISNEKDGTLKDIAAKIIGGVRISPEDGLYLFEKAGLPYLGSLANFVREKLHGNTTYFNRNFHNSKIEMDQSVQKKLP